MDELDPERALWVPSRRRFLFLGLGAAASVVLPTFGEVVKLHGVDWSKSPGYMVYFTNLPSNPCHYLPESAIVAAVERLQAAIRQPQGETLRWYDIERSTRWPPR